MASVPYVANKYSIHAEQDCIRKCKNKSIIKYCTLILVTIKNNMLGKCCYCSMCKHIGAGGLSPPQPIASITDLQLFDAQT